MYKTSLKLPAHVTNIEAAILGESADDLCSAHTAMREENTQNAPWIIEWLFPEQIEQRILRARLLITADIHNIDIPENFNFTHEDVPDINWLEHSYKQFPPFSVGPFFIYGSHYEDSVPDGLIGLQIDAATAFGSGEHGTTSGCLQAMLDLKGQGACPWNVLDMGTGSGILGIAAWKLWKTPVLAVDNDPEAVRVAAKHRDINNVPDSPTDMRCRCGNGFNEETVQLRKPFDLIIANILPGPLKEMAEALVDAADENGAIILSGILNEQAEDVLGVYQALGLEHRKTLEIGEWSTLMLRKPAA